MGLTYLRNPPTYQALSTDVVANKITGASNIGAIVHILDTNKFYKINSDLELVEFAYSVTTVSGSPVLTNCEGVVDENNSTATPLASGSTFVGEATDILKYGIVFVNVYSDVESSSSGLSIQQSSDGTNWDHDDNYTVPGRTGKNYSINPHSKYYRVSYTNGSGGSQSEFRLQSVPKGNSKPSSHRIQDSISTDDDAELVKSVLSAKTNGTFVNIEATDSNNLRVANVEDGFSIAKGDVSGTTFIHKFGAAEDIDIADGFVDIWDGASEQIHIYTYTSGSELIDSISSASAGDTTMIEIQGLDTNYALVTQSKSLNGQTRVQLDTGLRRVFRLKNSGSTNLVGDVYCYENTPLGGGVPVADGKVRAIIQEGNNQTLMAVYTVPAGKTGYMRNWYASTASLKKTVTNVVKVFAKPFGGVFQLKHVGSITDTGTSNAQHVYSEPEVFEAKTDIVIRANSDVDDAAVAAGFDIVLVDD